MSNVMKAAYLPGNSTVVLKYAPIPEPGYGEVLIKTKASTICGSDIRAIYREHLGKGPEGYMDKIAGHEPAGQIVKCGPGMRRFNEGDRVILYHISGCGLCYDCRRGLHDQLHEPAARGLRRAEGRGMAPIYCRRERSRAAAGRAHLSGRRARGLRLRYSVRGPREVGISGSDAVLVVGLGPVGLAALMLARAMERRSPSVSTPCGSAAA